MTPSPCLPSGSTITSAWRLVPAGGFDQDSVGDTLSPTQFGFFGLLPAFFFSSIVLSLEADDVSENTFAPVDGAPVLAQPPRWSAAMPPAKRMLASLGFTNMVVSSVVSLLRWIVSPGVPRTSTLSS